MLLCVAVWKHRRLARRQARASAVFGLRARLSLRKVNLAASTPAGKQSLLFRITSGAGRAIRWATLRKSCAFASVLAGDGTRVALAQLSIQRQPVIMASVAAGKLSIPTTAAEENSVRSAIARGASRGWAAFARHSRSTGLEAGFVAIGARTLTFSTCGGDSALNLKRVKSVGAAYLMAAVILCLCAPGCGGIIGSEAAPAAPARAEMVPPRSAPLSLPEVKLGVIARAGERRFVTRLINPTGNPLRWAKLRTSCDCVSVIESGKSLEPSDDVLAKISFDGSGRPEFIGSLTIEVTALAPDDTEVFRFNVSAEIVPEDELAFADEETQ